MWDVVKSPPSPFPHPHSHIPIPTRTHLMATYTGPGNPIPPDRSQANSKKMAAGLCGILLGVAGLGWLGVHKFILGYNKAGLIMLLSSLLTCGIVGIAMTVISIIEGIVYLTKSDDEFYETYMVRQKEWF